MARSKRQRIGAYAIIRDSNSILLCRLSKEIPKWEGYWTLPGGGIEFGESPEKAMIREVFEETGLVVTAKNLVMISNIHDISEEKEFHGVRIIFNVEIVGGNLKSETNGSTDLCRWHSFPPPGDLKLVDLSEETISFLLNPKAEPVAGGDAAR